MPRVIDLNDFRRGGSARLFAGRSRGEAVRDAVGLKRLLSDAPIEVRVPKDVIGLTTSFFLGMFGDLVAELGEATFREKFRFTGKNVSIVIDDGIAEALKNESPIPSPHAA